MIKFCFSLVFSGPKFPNFLSPFPLFSSKQGTPGWKSQGLIPLPNLIARVAGRDRIAGGVECKRNTMQLHQLQRGSIFHLLWLSLILQLPQPTPTDTYKGHNDGQKQRAIGVLFIANIAILLCHQCDGKLYVTFDHHRYHQKVGGKETMSKVRCWTIFTITSNHFRHIPVQPRNRHHHHVE